MVKLYADLVMANLRTTDEQRSIDEGIILVPISLRAQVVTELELRGTDIR